MTKIRKRRSDITYLVETDQTDTQRYGDKDPFPIKEITVYEYWKEDQCNHLSISVSNGDLEDYYAANYFSPTDAKLPQIVKEVLNLHFQGVPHD